VKAVFKEDKVKEFKISLEQIKTTLLLARQSRLEYVNLYPQLSGTR